MNVDGRKHARISSTSQPGREDRTLVHALARQFGALFKRRTPDVDAYTANVSAQSHPTGVMPGTGSAKLPKKERRKSIYPSATERALNVLHCPVVIVGARCTVRHVNAEAHDLFGDKVVGRNLGLFFREPKAMEAVQHVLRDGGTQTVNVNLDVPIQRQYKLVVSRLSAVPGEAPHAVLEFQENTLIMRSESMRSEFVANVSHELRSPLATLIGFIETMQTATEAPDSLDVVAQARFLSIMEGEAHRMSRMIDDLLSLTNVELHEHERPRTRVDIVTLLREVVDALAARGKRKDVEIVLDCPDDIRHVGGDRDQLIQVFHNLLTNAIKYGGSGGRVEVRAMATENGLPDGGPSVQISVRDYGDGIEAEHLPRLTERFYRIDKGRSRAMGGTGLGLAIVKHIVNRHRGRFQIESTIGEGSTFHVRLPVCKNSE